MMDKGGLTRLLSVEELRQIPQLPKMYIGKGKDQDRKKQMKLE